MLKGHPRRSASSWRNGQDQRPAWRRPLHFRRAGQSGTSAHFGKLPAASDSATACGNGRPAGEERLQAPGHHARDHGILRGQVTVARDDIEQGLVLYDSDLHRDHWTIYGLHDPASAHVPRGLYALAIGARERGASVGGRDPCRDALGHSFAVGRAWLRFLLHDGRRCSSRARSREFPGRDCSGGQARIAGCVVEVHQRLGNEPSVSLDVGP